MTFFVCGVASAGAALTTFLGLKPTMQKAVMRPHARYGPRLGRWNEQSSYPVGR
jgi:hypothetical protein